MNIQQQVKELAEDPKLKSLVLPNNAFIVEKYVFFDNKHPDRNPLKRLTAKDSNIYHFTLELCRSGKHDTYSKTTERRLLRYFIFYYI